jgi:hypothetical protein
MRVFYAWYSNQVDHRDDEPIKIRAKNEKDAREIALRHLDEHRFTLKEVYPASLFRKIYPGWVHLLGRHQGVSR